MGALSRIRLWRSGTDYLTFDYAAARPRFATQGERIVDRLGRVHRIAPPAPRVPTGLAVTLLPEELTRLNCAQASVRQHAVAWLEQAFCQQEGLDIFVWGQSISDANSAIARQLCYRGYLETLPLSGFGSLPGSGGGDEPAELELTIIADGTFSDFEVLASAQYSAR
jgi:hypothetical protein